MSFSEYHGSKTKVSQTVGRIFKNAQDSFPKIQTSQTIGSFLKTLSPSGSNNGTEHERLSKQTSPPTLPSSKFGFQKFRLRTGSEKKRSGKHRAELLDNQDVGDHEDSEDEAEYYHSHHYPPKPHATVIDIPPKPSPTTTKKEKMWRF